MDLTELATLDEFLGGKALPRARGRRRNSALVVASGTRAVGTRPRRAVAEGRLRMAGFLLLVGTAWVACGDASRPGPEMAAAPSARGACAEEQVVEAARRVTGEYCSGANGCDFNPRLERGASAGQGYPDPPEEWIVIVSLIHSFDETGQPRFMPEGARIVRVSTDCTPTSMLGHGGPIPLPDP